VAKCRKSSLGRDPNDRAHQAYAVADFVRLRYPDLILTPWVLGRRVPIEVYGPRGIKAMTEHVLAAYSEDFAARTRDRELYTVGAFPEGHAVNAREIESGVIYKDANVTVTAFARRTSMPAPDATC
jgi:ribonuclease BN (tRNA processing enzyme)